MKDGDGGRTAGPSVVVCCLAKTHYFYLLIVPLNRFDRLLVCLAIQQELFRKIKDRGFCQTTNNYTWSLKQ